MPQPFDGLRISVPEIVYARLDEPGNPDVQLAFDGLSHLFELEQPHRRDREGWATISDAMIEDSSGITLPGDRPFQENAKQVLGHIQNYPWLRNISPHPGARPEVITSSEFFAMFSNHVVDDYPGLFGVTIREAKILRAKAQDQRFDLTGLAEEIGITHLY